MKVFAQPFWVPKAGNKDGEYEDAVWPTKLMHEENNCFRFAVADGATETSYSGIWARQLVRYFCKNRFDSSFVREGLPNLQQRWTASVRKRPLPWYAEEKMRLGAFAAIVAIVLHDDLHGDGRHGTWQALGIGDSCVVQMRGEEVLAQFPLTDSISFNNRPHLLSSNPSHNNVVLDHLRETDGIWQQGDAFYFMTDALACWFMREVEEERMPWHILRDLNTSDEILPFCKWVETLREKSAIRNDDVTLLRVDIM